MKKIFLITLLIAHAIIGFSQSELWITGSAVPEGTQKLVAFPDGRFKYAGTLLKGELKVMTTATPGANTQYLTPTRVDSYIVNNGLPYTLTQNAGDAAWQVTFDEDRYRFTIHTVDKKLKGELFQPWDELFMVGGCLSCGWEGHYFLPFTRDEGELCAYTWIGEMKERSEFTEPRRFKIMGQNAWDPKSLHPFRQDEVIGTSEAVLTNESDNKWNFDKEGFYMIKVDVFHETIKSTYLGKTYNP